MPICHGFINTKREREAAGRDQETAFVYKFQVKECNYTAQTGRGRSPIISHIYAYTTIYIESS